MEYGASGDSGSAQAFDLEPRRGAAVAAPDALQQPATAPVGAAATTAAPGQTQLQWSHWRTASGEAAQDGSAQLGQPLTWQAPPTHIAAASPRLQQHPAAAEFRLGHEPLQVTAAGGLASGSMRSGSFSHVGRPPPGPSWPGGAVAAAPHPQADPAEPRWPRAQAQRLEQSPMLCGEQLVWPGEPQPRSASFAATAAAAAPTAAAPAGAPSAGPFSVAAPASNAAGPAVTAADVDLSGSFAFAPPSAGGGVPNGNRSFSGTPQQTFVESERDGDAATGGSSGAYRVISSSVAGAAAVAAVAAAAAAAAARQQQQQQQQEDAAAVPAQQQRPQQRASQRVRRSKAVAEAQQLAAAAMPPPTVKAGAARRGGKTSSRSSATPPASDASAGARTTSGYGLYPSFTAGAGGSGSYSAAAGAEALIAPPGGGAVASYDSAAGTWLPQEGPLAGLINLRSPPGLARMAGNSIQCVLGGKTAPSASASATQEIMAPGPPPAQPGFSFLPFGGAPAAGAARAAAERGKASVATVARGSSSAAGGTPVQHSAAAAAPPDGTGSSAVGYGGGRDLATSAWLQRSYSDALQPGEPRAPYRPVGGDFMESSQAHLHNPPPAGLSPAAGSGEVAYLPVIYHAGYAPHPQQQPQQQQQSGRHHQLPARQPSTEALQQQSQAQSQYQYQQQAEPQPAAQYASYPPTQQQQQQPAQMLFSQPSLPYPHPAQQGVYALGQQPQYSQHAPEYGQQYPYPGQVPPPQPHYAYSVPGYEAYPQMWYYAVPAAAAGSVAGGASAAGHEQEAATAGSSDYYCGSWAMQASGAAAAAGPYAPSSLYEQYSGPLGAQMQSAGQGSGGDAPTAGYRLPAGSQPTASPFRMDLSQPAAVTEARAAAGDRDARPQPSQAFGYAGEAAAAGPYPRSHQQHQQHYPQQPAERQQLAWNGLSAQQGPTTMYPQQPPAPAPASAAPHSYEQERSTQAPTQPDQHEPPQHTPYMLDLQDMCLLMDIGSPGSFRHLRRISADGGGGGAATAALAAATPAAALPSASPAGRGAGGADYASMSPLALAALLGSPAGISRRASLALNLSRHDGAAAAATQGWLSPLPGLNRASAKPPPGASAHAAVASAAATAAAAVATAAFAAASRARAIDSAAGGEELGEASEQFGQQEEADAGFRRSRVPRRAASAGRDADAGSAAVVPAPRQQRRGRQRAPSVPAAVPDGAAGMATAPQLDGPGTAATAAGEAVPQPAAAAVAIAADAAAGASGATAATPSRPRAPVATAAAPFGVSPSRGAGAAAEDDPDAMMSLFGSRDEDYNMFGSPGGLGGLGLGLGLGLGQQWSLTPLRSPSSLLVPGWRSTLPSALAGLTVDGGAGGAGSRSTAEGSEQLSQAAGLLVPGRASQAASPLRQHGAAGPCCSDESPGVLLLLRPNRLDAGGATSIGAAATADAPGVVVAPASAAGSAFTRATEPEAYLLRSAGDGGDAPATMAAQSCDTRGADGGNVQGHPQPPRKALHLSTVGGGGKDEGAAAVASEQTAPGQETAAAQPKRAMLRRRGRLLQSEMERAALGAAAGAASVADQQPLLGAPRRAAAVAAAAAIAQQAAMTDDGRRTATVTASAPGPLQQSTSEERTVTVDMRPAHHAALEDCGAVDSAAPVAATCVASRGAQDTASGLTVRGKRPRSASAPATSAEVLQALGASGAAVALAAGIGGKQPAASSGSSARRKRAAAPLSKPSAAEPPAEQRAGRVPEAKVGCSSATGTGRSADALKMAPAAPARRLQTKQGREQQVSAEAAKEQEAQPVAPPPAKRRRVESKAAGTDSAGTPLEAKAQPSAANKATAATASAAAAVGQPRRPPRHPHSRAGAHTSADLRGQRQPPTPTAEQALTVMPHAADLLRRPPAPQPAEVLPASGRPNEPEAQPAARNGVLAAVPQPTAASGGHVSSAQPPQAPAPQVKQLALAGTGEAAAAPAEPVSDAAAQPPGGAPQTSADPMDVESAGAQPPASQAPSIAAGDANQQSQEQRREDQQHKPEGVEPLPQLPHKKRLLLQREMQRNGPVAGLGQPPAGEAAVGAVAGVASATAPALTVATTSATQLLAPVAAEAAAQVAGAAEVPVAMDAAAGAQSPQQRQRRKAPQLQSERAGTVAAPPAGGPAAADGGAGPSTVRQRAGDDASGSGTQGRAGRNGLPASLLVVQPRAAAVRAAAAIAGSAKGAAKSASGGGQAEAGKKRGVPDASEEAGDALTRKRQAVEASVKRGAAGAASAAAGGSAASGSGRQSRVGAEAEALPRAPPSPKAAAAAEALTALGGGAGRGRGAVGGSRPQSGVGSAAANRAKPAARASGQGTANQGRGRAAQQVTRTSGGAGTSAGAAGGAAAAGGYTAAPVPQARARAAAAAAQEEAVANPKQKGTIRRPGQIPNVVAAAASILLQLKPGVKAYEKTFRQEFGNNPDTSKALRLLMERGHVVRSGRGFRSDPFGYTVTQEGLDAAEEQRRREREAGADN